MSLMYKTKKRTIKFSRFDIKLKIIYKFLLFLIFVVLFLKTYSPHFKNPYPIHVDEWQHLAQIVAAEKGKINYNPYFDEPHTDLELFFHLFWAAFFKIFKLNEVLFYSYLPAIFSVITGLTLYYLMLKISNRISAIFSLIIMLSWKSTVSFLGLKYFTPLTMSFPLIYLSILFFIKLLEKKNLRNLVFFAILFLLTILIYPPSGIILGYGFLIELLIMKQNEKDKYYLLLKRIAYLGILIVILGLILLYKKNLLERLFIFKIGWSGFETKYSIALLFGIITTMFAIFGIIKNIEKEKFRILIILTLLSLFLIFLFNMFDFTIIVPYQRALHYSVLFLTPLAAIGIKEFLTIISKISKKTSNILNLLLAVLIIFLILTSRYSKVENQETYEWKVLNKEMYEKLNAIKQKYPENSIVVMTPIYNTPAIYPVARQRAQAILPAQLGAGYGQDERIIDNIKYYAENTTNKEKEEILKKWNVGVVLG
ncbi:MAG: hypothetical protein ACP5OZ_02655 [Candidatus Woesearchaeota archaeon]